MMILKKYVKKMLDFIYNHKILLIFTLFFSLVFFQHQFLFLYHDDYGYASLSYPYLFDDIITLGHQNSLKSIFLFLGKHYNVWGGRILFIFVQCVILNTSLELFRFVQSVIITLIFYMIYKIVYFYVKDKKEVIALLSCSCYGLIQLLTFKSGIFWISASATYVFPVLFLLLFFYLFITRDNYKLDTKLRKLVFEFLMLLLIFIASFSQEQTAIVALGLSVILMLNGFVKNKKIQLNNLLYVVSSLVGFLILMLSPGNYVRMQTSSFYELGLFEKVKFAFPGLLLNIYGASDQIIIMLLLIVSIFYSFKLICNDKNKFTFKLLSISLINAILMIFITLFSNGGYYVNLCSLLHISIYRLLPCIIISIQTGLVVIPIIIYLYKNKRNLLMWLFILSLLSQISMLCTSYFPMRSMLIFDFLFFIIFIDFLLDVFKNKKFNKYFQNIVIISIVLFSCLNFVYITYGYYCNADINKENDSTLKEVSRNIKQGETIRSVRIKKLKDDMFADAMPYHDNHEYVENMIRTYYDLPHNIKFEYYQ